ncbi:NADH-quinone oxidoreductase subunit C [Vulgatibacter incomptus]|uniref:NADH-ubiquinone oxidoreductase chain C n=1 Tax=Vulgatibacter incomptus TaxID=1391653 RepID=A0A0K1PAY4_9BACT|nr:NADH-quinone oxidoreductase subunit C [Vulgatibacter incomptus]AKU90685.1 NADH-ubiquinone oxidoreductase chain C [Vulgatibacter incomptus]
MSEKALQRVAEKFPDAIVHGYAQHGDETLVVKRESLVDVMRFCHDDPELELKMPSSLTCVDYIDEKPRFELVYSLYSITLKHRLRIKVRVGEDDPTVPSVISVYRGMNFWERYCWDMYGIRFTDREADMKRLWLYEEFEGHPLRKDYPLRGRQGLIPELDVRDITRGPGPGPGSGPAARAAVARPSQLPILK